MRSRREFLKSTAILPFVYPVWFDAHAQDGTQCTLPATGTPTQLIPNESNLLTYTNAR
jgi:hypothetical protein